jgi:hypothetical protein
VNASNPALEHRIVDLPEGFLKALGLISVRWAALEDLSVRWIMTFSGGEPPDLLALVAHLGFRERFGAVRSLVELHTPDADIHGELASLIERIVEKLSRRRNKYLHRPWRINDGIPGQLRISSRTGLEINWVKVTEEQLTDLSRDIEKAMEDLEDICKRCVIAAVEKASRDRS